ncbi:hypothetical protein Zmor_021973 [Zophobas morio]|uniref:Uncharacterized protein n=1 Tax=Zophobas morio TaxID=2755281 RepID=A0AA38I732_9CUCU|nr:hypothetical protein Zmor_021973 [Zophobas morio]
MEKPDLKIGQYVAVHSIEEPFFLAKLLNVRDKSKIKIKWLEKKSGAMYSVSYDDHISEENIICTVTVTNKSRFMFVLPSEEEKKVLSLLNVDSRNSTSDTDGSFIKTITETVSDDLKLRSSPITLSNINTKIILNETQSISSGVLFDLTSAQKDNLLPNTHILTGNNAEGKNNDKNRYELPETPTPPFVSSGSEYIPSTDESDIEIPSAKKIKYHLNSVFSEHCAEENSGSNSGQDGTSPVTKQKELKQVAKCQGIDESDSDGSNTEVSVTYNRKTKTGDRVYDKKHVCYFCYKSIGKITRHLIIMHSKEIEVARLLSLDAKSAERKEGFLCILRAGDYYHNIEVLTSRKGNLILSRRPNDKDSLLYKKYGPCPNCLGFFLISNLWHHIKYNCPKKCALNHSTQDKSVSRRDVRGESYALLGQHLNVSTDFVRHILGNLKNDDIGTLCKEDEVIVKYGCMMYEKYTSQQHEYVRQSMRQLSRLLLEVQKSNSQITKFEQIMLPINFDILIAATQRLCVATRNETNSSRCYNIPSLALKLGHGLRKSALIVRGIALRKGDLTMNREMESFLDLMTLEWNAKVSSAALRTLREKQMNATQLLPVTADIMKLNEFLDIVIKDLIQDKNLKFSPQNWQRLAQATLCRIILFNKRRSGEAARMTLHQYAIRPNWKEQCTSELKESLTPLENSLANNLTVVEVVGKSRKNFKVPIILTHQMKAAVDKLIEIRDDVGIARDNIYVFSRGSGSKKSLRGHDCIRKFANEANLQSPSLLTSTKLRKYIATVVQILDLKHKEYDWLARHLGHDIRIHREFYRLHESAVELTKVSRLLLTLDKGEISNFKGKSLDEINVAELPNIDSENETRNDITDEEHDISDEDDSRSKNTRLENISASSAEDSDDHVLKSAVSTKFSTVKKREVASIKHQGETVILLLIILSSQSYKYPMLFIFYHK